MKYIVIKTNKILRVYETNEDEAGVKKALSNIGITEYDEIKTIEKTESFITIDENNYYSGKVKPYNDMEYIHVEPELRDGYIPKWNGESWEYVKDINGEWYHKETQQMIQVSDNKTDEDISHYTRLKPDDLTKWDTDKWVFDYESYRNMICGELRSKCREEREVFFPDSVKDNILIGIIYSNPALTLENYKKIAELYINIVRENEPKIFMAETKEEIDSLYDKIQFPTLEQIMNYINRGE